MRTLIESRYDQFISDLKTIVNIDSGSRNPKGLSAVRSFFQERFSRLGWQTEAHDFENGNTPCLEAVSPGSGKKNERFDFLFLGIWTRSSEKGPRPGVHSPSGTVGRWGRAYAT